MKTYTIRHDPVREKRGLKSWGVFEQVASDFTQGISQHHTVQEALAAKVELENKENRSGDPARPR